MTKFVLIKYPQSSLDIMAVDDWMPPDADVGATDMGNETAFQIGRVLAAQFNGRFFVTSGPAKRCVEPAISISESLGQEVAVEHRLDERRMFDSEDRLTVAQFRQRQERGFLDPARRGEGEKESPLEHRLRVEGWLAEILSTAASEDIYIVVSHGSVIEHLHSSLSWKPTGAMEASFTFCAPGHAHLWSDVLLPDMRRIWCCLGSNVDLTERHTLETPLRGAADLNELAVELALDPRFSGLVEGQSGAEIMSPHEKYYIR